MMNTPEDDCYSFITEWYDPFASLVRRYKITYYTEDSSVEMFDIKAHKMFLKRNKVDNLSMRDLYIGSIINICSRALHIVDYADDYTRRKFSSRKEKTFAMIKPECVNKVGQILDIITQKGFMVSKLKMCQLSRTEVFNFYEEHKGKPFLDDLVNYISSGPVIAMELMGQNAVQTWRALMGPTDPSVARKEAPNSIRARFGTDKTQNACHGADSQGSAARELEFFFSSKGPSRQNTAKYTNCTCCVIKPHAVLDGVAGKILSAIIEAGFEISAMQMVNMEQANAEEFYEVYKGVIQEYYAMVKELTHGPCIALEIRSEDAPTKFRDMAGPADPEIARHLRPRTLRALYGKDKIQNAIHCTDLPEDGLLEVEYFFKILDR
ncbi:nucleoside diphosphate kinase homolog 7-like [Liolophura sinensis]|uniref:nucleoside diphosphate kinase homolog 7-like n=1 Tax=Liolophura sinensis TaxID=3198878 RepID=UPI0031580C1A